jgi:hypothetical protein
MGADRRCRRAADNIRYSQSMAISLWNAFLLLILVQIGPKFIRRMASRQLPKVAQDRQVASSRVGLVCAAILQQDRHCQFAE